LIKLKRDEYDIVRPLVKQLKDLKSFPYSVIEHRSPGGIYVDNKTDVKNVFICSKWEIGTLICDEENIEFNHAVLDYIVGSYNFEAKEKGMASISLDCHPQKYWETVISKHIPNIKVDYSNCNVYTYPKETSTIIEDKTGLPDGFKLERMLEYHYVKVKKDWGITDQFSMQGFGYLILNGENIVSACYSDYVGDNHFEMAVFTAKAYRGKGYGKIVSRAFLNECRTFGYKPSWICSTRNEASNQLALSLGFNYKANCDLLSLKKEI